MSVTVPPSGIWRPLGLWIPGLWSAFYDRANAALRAAPGASITSWWRSSSDNRRVGGSTRSQHLLGLALDLVPGRSGLSMAGLEARVRRVGFGFTLNEGDHVHVQLYKAGVLDAAGVFRALGL